MELTATSTGIFTFCIITFSYVFFAQRTSLGALSLPCVALLTSIIYYYVMPSLAFIDGGAEFLGLYMDSMEEIQWGVLLYAIGVAAAGLLGMRILRENPVIPLPDQPRFNKTAYWVVAVLSASGLVVLTINDRLNLTFSDSFTANEVEDKFRFLQHSLSMLLPLTIVYLVRDNFGLRSITLLTAVTSIFLVSGFRFRIAILMIAATSAYSLMRGRKLGVFATAVGVCVVLIIFNAIGRARIYGAGIDFSRFQDISVPELLRSFGGEVGPIFAFFSVIRSPPPALIGTEPWTLAISRLVPSFIWPDKPYPEYLLNYTLAFEDNVRRSAGIAGPQQAEILMQFGWLGLPFIACAYFLMAIFILKMLRRASREARIAGAVLLPGVIGFYMQQRGYFFQNLSEVLSIIGPLFFMHHRRKASHSSMQASTQHETAHQ